MRMEGGKTNGLVRVYGAHEREAMNSLNPLNKNELVIMWKGMEGRARLRPGHEWKTNKSPLNSL